MENAEFVDSLRKLADFFEAHPDLKVPYSMSGDGIIIFANGKEEISLAARAFGSCDKTSDDIFYRVVKKDPIGQFKLSAIEYRSQVCERVVTGKRVIPAQTVPEHTIPERTEEIVEWRCPESILETEVGSA